MDYILEFLDAKAVEGGVSMNTIEAYRSDIAQFAVFLENKEFLDAKVEDIEAYLEDLQLRGNSAKTISRKISCIREFYKFLISEKLITDNPTNRLRTPKIGKGLPEVLTTSEIEKIYRYTQQLRGGCGRKMGVMVRLMYSVGLRVSEMISLRDNSINFEQKQILIHGKGNKERVVPVSNDTIEEVKAYLEYKNSIKLISKDNWLFPSYRSKTGHITRDAFFKNLKKIAIQAGIAPHRAHPHVLRHSFATELVNNNADLRSIQKMLGHENIITTEIYTHISVQKLVDEVNKRHPLSLNIGQEEK
ncbi:MAG: tyrosine recombinase [Alphaproteobacteria bacterium]|nr:tyrosine recombinase [Alphaproteobacteria bacterium]